jgi:hypothetical protein
MPKKTAKRASSKKVAKPTSAAATLARLIAQLRSEHQDHLDAIAEIDQTLKDFGVSFGDKTVKGTGIKAASRKGKGKRSGPTKANGARKSARKAPARGRAAAGTTAKGKAAKAAGKAGKASKFPQTGDELILDFIKATGGATTEEIRKHWASVGRKSKAENNLTTLVRGSKLRRVKQEGMPGSRYVLP